MATETGPVLPAGVPGAARRGTIGDLWRRGARERLSPDPYLVETAAGWAPVPWDDVHDRVEALANGFLATGLAKGDAVAILARTSLEWVLVDFALALVGAVSVPLYTNTSAKECAYVLADSGAVAAVVEGDAEAALVKEARAQAPALRDVTRFAELPEVEARGRAHAAAQPGALASAEDAVGPDDVYTVIYTSGTTGPPKGCVIRHRNYHAMVGCLDELGDFVRADDLILLYLPLAHNFGRLMHLAGPYAGLSIALLGDPLRAAEVMPLVRPTILPSVPRVYEKIESAVRREIDASSPAKRRVAQWALGVGRRTSPYRQRGLELPRGLAAQHALADRLLYARVKERLGGRLRFGISGGAPLGRETAEFLHHLDVLVLEGYGLTECTTAATVNRPRNVRFGTVGPALPGVELRVEDDGEILIRSPTVFAGYRGDEAATRAVLDEDGWLRSGDVGLVDAEGFLHITGRKKDIIVTAGGKNVSPQNVESALKASPLVSHALVVGDRRPFVAALLTLDPDAVEAWARARGLPGAVDELAASTELRAALQQAVDAVNADLSRHEQVKRFAVLARDFAVESGELTATLKVRRRAAEERHAAEIERIYAA